MATGPEIIKEYLVQLGFSVDNTTQAKIKRTLQELEGQLNTLSNNKAFSILAKGATAYVTAITAVATASAGLLSKASQADMQWEKMALRMHMTKDATYAFVSAQKALGASVEEIVWIPELRKQYHEMKNLALELDSSADAKANFKMIREVEFEFTKMKFIATRMAVSVAADLAKLLSGGKSFKEFLVDVNKWLKENFAETSQKIAKALRSIIGVGEVLINVVKGAYAGFKNIVQILPDVAKQFTIFFGALALGLKLNPTLLMLSSLFLLMEDYWVWSQGKANKDPNKKFVSSLDDLWENLHKIGEPLKEAFGDLKEAFGMFDEQSIRFTFFEAFEALINRIGIGISTIVLGMTSIARLAIHFMKLYNVDKEIDASIDAKYKKEEEEILKRRKSERGPGPYFLKYAPLEDLKKRKAAEKKELLEAAQTATRVESIEAMSKGVDTYYALIEALTNKKQIIPKSAPQTIITPGATNAPRMQGSKDIKGNYPMYIPSEFQRKVPGDNTTTYDAVININNMHVQVKDAAGFYREMQGLVQNARRQQMQATPAH